MSEPRSEERRSPRERRPVPGSITYDPHEDGCWLVKSKTVPGEKRRTIGRFNTRAAAERALAEYAAKVGA